MLIGSINSNSLPMINGCGCMFKNIWTFQFRKVNFF
jgi:hypothetical protein